MYGVINPLDIRSCYAESKRMGENICASWGHQYNLHTGIVRPFHTYGPGISLDDGRVFADFIADFLLQRDMKITGNGSTKRVFCYITDAVTGFLTVLLKGKKGEAYNVANPEAEISVLNLAKLLASKSISHNLNVIYDPIPLNINYFKSNFVKATPSIEKIMNIGWQPKIGLDEGFTRTLKSYSK
jgi:nucleoside-diphosphate-sugar epimerase